MNPTTPNGAVAIVTGASRGIGAVAARALADAGAAVTVAARDTNALIALAGAIGQTGGRALAVPTDVTDPGDVRHLVRYTLDSYGRLDIAVNAAAGELSLCLREQIRAMLDTAGGGAVVNLACGPGRDAVIGLTEATARAYAAKGVRVDAVDSAEAVVRLCTDHAIEAARP